MNAFNRILIIFKQYLFWQPVLKIFVYIGFLLLACSLLIAFKSPRLASVIAVLGFLCSGCAPYMTAGIIFRHLVSNPQLALAKDFSVTALIALFIFTLLISGFLPFISLFIFIEIKLISALHIFSLCSLLVAVFQINLPRKYSALLWQVPWLFVVFFRILPTTFTTYFFNPFITVIYSALIFTGWFIFYRHLQKSPLLSPNAISIATISGSANSWDYQSQITWGKYFQSKTFNSASDSLFNGSFTSWNTRFNKNAFVIIILPLILDLLIFIMNIENKSPNSNENASLAGLFLFISTLTATTLMIGFSELFKRSRFLWLRTGTDRASIWKIIEKNIFHEMLVIMLLCTATAMILVLFTEITYRAFYTYTSTAFIGGIYFTYYGIYLRMKSNLIVEIGLIIGLIICAIALFLSAIFAYTQQNYTPLLISELLLLAIGLFFRGLCLRAFQHVDWIVVKPKKINSRRQLAT